MKLHIILIICFKIKNFNWLLSFNNIFNRSNIIYVIFKIHNEIKIKSLANYNIILIYY